MVIHGSNSSDIMVPMITCVASGSQNIINGEMKRDLHIQIIISRLKVNNENATKMHILANQQNLTI